jgi:hypothetical protein
LPAKKLAGGFMARKEIVVEELVEVIFGSFKFHVGNPT